MEEEKGRRFVSLAMLSSPLLPLNWEVMVVLVGVGVLMGPLVCQGSWRVVLLLFAGMVIIIVGAVAVVLVCLCLFRCLFTEGWVDGVKFPNNHVAEGCNGGTHLVRKFGDYFLQVTDLLDHGSILLHYHYVDFCPVAGRLLCWGGRGCEPLLIG